MWERLLTQVQPITSDTLSVWVCVRVFASSFSSLLILEKRAECMNRADTIDEHTNAIEATLK